jgi:hypothetical protein
MSTSPETRAKHHTVEIEVEHALVVAYRKAAGKRGLKATSLIHELLDVIVADQLIDAIMDDQP